MNDNPTTAAEARAEELQQKLDKLRRREKRNLRHATAHGFLDGVCAMLRPGNVVIDCGANIGEVSEQLAMTGAQLYAFEPDPFAFGKLTERLAGRQNVQLLQQAVSTENGTLRLMRASNFDDAPKGASVKSTLISGGRGVDEKDGIDVQVIDFPAFLLRLLAEHGEIDFLKMDIEGAELDLIEKMDEQGLLSRIRCVVVETHERKFKELRPRYQEMREKIAGKYEPGHVNLDWI